MITQTYLESRPDLCVPIKQPQAWAIEGYYPTTYCIRYLADDEIHRVARGIRPPECRLVLRAPVSVNKAVLANKTVLL